MILTDKNISIISTLTPPHFDADAVSFITAASITSTTQITAINNLVFNLKQNNLWNKMTAIYPFVGGTANSHKYNLKDPRYVDAAYRIGFSGGGWTHTSGGIQGNGTSSYANTFLNDNTVQVFGNSHISIYSRTELSVNACSIGVNVQQGVTDYSTSIYIRQSNNTVFYPNQSTFTSVTNTTSLGFFINSRINTTSTTINRNGTIIGTHGINSFTKSSVNYYIGALNNPALGTVGSAFSSRQYAFASIGSGLTDSEQSIFNTPFE